MKKLIAFVCVEKLIVFVCVASLVGGIVAYSRMSGGRSLTPLDTPETPAPVNIAAASDPAAPSGTVVQLLDATRAFDPAAMQRHVTPARSTTAIISGGRILADQSPQSVQIIQGFTGNLEYIILSEAIHGDRATVETQIKVADFSGVISTMLTELTRYAATQTIMSRPIELEKFAGEFLREKVDFSKLSTVTTNATVHLEKGDDGWLVVNDSDKNKELVNALTGGMLDQLMNLNELAKRFS